ncbi:MAG: hypothetical protein WA691_05385 [Thermoplasmata archaeon]
MKGRLGAFTAIVAVVSAFLMVFVVPAGIAAASSPAVTPGPAFTLWAYGVVKTVDFSGSSADHFDYQGSATYGYSVILNQTNLTPSTFELSVNRTMGALLSVEYCSPTCKNPSVTATVSDHSWEAIDAWANFTTQGTVFEDGQSVAAIGLLNSHSTIVGSLLDTAAGPLRSSYLSANVSASSDVSFASPLGLLPENLTGTTPVSWNSSSAFVASGTYTVGYFYHYRGPKAATTVGSGPVSAAVVRSGNVTVLGSTGAGPQGTVDLGGVPYLDVSLSVEGPFVAREGFILVPDEVDLFGSSSTAAWSGNESGATTVQMTSLYVRPNSGPHLGIDGSEWLYSASSLNPSSTSVAPIAGGAVQISSASDNVGSTTLQGVPIPVSQAQGYQGCLVSGAACPSGSTRPGLPLLTLGVLALAVVVAVVAVAVTERRRIPPPTYPNAKLYPPGDSRATKPSGNAAASGDRRPAAPADDDPLSNLW